MNYKWSCSACDEPNEAKSGYCHACGCPGIADGWMIAGWKKSLSQPSEKPTLNTMNVPLWGVFGIVTHKVSPCPSCFLHMYITSGQCPHCEYKLSLPERYALVENYRAAVRYGKKLGLIFFPALIVIATFVIYVYRNF